MQKEKDLLSQYAEISQKIKLLDEQKVALGKQILEQMEWEGQTQYKNDLGVFSQMKRKTFTYSANVDLLSEKLKKQKQIEEIEGIAVAKESISITFRANKLK